MNSKRILAGVLGALMVLQMMPVTALASEPNDAQSIPGGVSAPVIEDHEHDFETNAPVLSDDGKKLIYTCSVDGCEATKEEDYVPDTPTMTNDDLGTDEGNGGETIRSNAVAQIGETQYETLAEAVAAATDSTPTTITLLDNIYLEKSVEIPANQNIILDLQGKQITVSQTEGRSLYAIQNKGTLTIQDTTESASGSIIARGVENYGTMYMKSGTIASCDSNGGGAAIWNEGTLEMTGGTLKFTGEKSGNNAGSPFTNAINTATATITGGALESPYTAIFVNAGKVSVENITLSTKTDYWMTVKVTGGEVNLKNVTITTDKGGCLENAGGIAVLENCTFTQTTTGNPNYNSSTVAVSNGGTITVKSGTYKSSSFGAYVFNSGGTINIEGGTFNAPTVLKADDSTSTAKSVINVSGGNFVGNYEIGDSSTLSITGGTFNNNDISKYIAKDYTYDPTTGTVTSTHVAVIGDAKYSTLKEAIEKATSEQTVQLLCDVTESITIPADKNITLDLAGHKLTNRDANHTITNNGTLTITDSSTGAAGTVDNVSHGKAAVYNAVGGVCTIEEGIFSRSSEASYIDDNGDTQNGGNSFYTIQNQGTMTIKGGTFKASDSNPGYLSSLVANGWQDGSKNTSKETAKLTITSGTFIGGYNTIKNDEWGELNITNGSFSDAYDTVVMNYNKAEISGGTFNTTGSHNGYAVYNDDYDTKTSVGQLTIYGGTFTSVENTLVNYNSKGNAKITIQGGSFESSESYALYTNGDVGISNGTFTSQASVAIYANNGNLNITGGTFTSPSNYYVTFTNTSGGATASITGGTYSSQYINNQSPDVYSPGRIPAQNADSQTYSLTKLTADNAIASVTDGDTPSYYASVSGAVTAAESSTTKSEITITLLRDTSSGGVTFENGKNITFDLGDHTLTLTGSLNLRRGHLTLTNGTISYPSGQAVNVWGSETDQADYSVLTIASDATVSGAYGICLFPVTNEGKVSYGAKINVEGIVNGVIFVSGNLGNSKNTADALMSSENTPVINVMNGAKIDGGTDEQGIAMNGYAIVNVKDGASITGREAIGVKRGVLNITGGSFTATGAKMDPATANNNGTEETGAAISITSTYNYAGTIGVKISGGTFTSTNNAALYVGHSSKNNAPTVYECGLELAIENGSFTGGSGEASVYIADAIEGDAASYTQDVISGGTYSSNVTQYCVTGKKAVTESGNTTYSITKANKRTIVTYSGMTDGSITSVANASGGGSYYEGDTVTLKASATSGLAFKGWYEVSNIEKSATGIITGISYGNRVSETPEYTFTVPDGSEEIKYIAIYESTGDKVTLRIGGADFSVNGTPQTSGYHSTFAVGTQITVNYIGASNFYHWKNGSDKITSTKAEYTFTIVSDTDLTPVFLNESGTSNAAFVEFVSAYGQVLQANIWNSTDMATKHTLPAGPSKLGGTFLYWSMNADAASPAEATVDSILASIKGNGSNKHITVKPVYETTGKKYTITIHYPDADIDTTSYANLEEGTAISVTAKTIAGKKFSHWAGDADGTQILSYSQTYGVQVSKNVTLYPIYVNEDTEVTAVPTISVTNIFANIVDDKNKVSFEVTYDIPDGYELVEHGVLKTTEDNLATANNMVVDAQGIDKFRSTITNKKGILTLNVNMTGQESTDVHVRGYLIVKNTDTNEILPTIYSEIGSGNYQDLSNSN